MTAFKAILGGVVALSIGTIVQADELKLAHFSSTKYHLHNEMFLPLAEQIAEATGGDTTIRVFPGGELGAGPVKQYDRVLDGVADIDLTTDAHPADIKRIVSPHVDVIWTQGEFWRDDMVWSERMVPDPWSGVYIYRVTDDEGGEIVGRFTIIR